MSSVQGRSKTLLLASAGVGLAICGGAILMHQRFKSRLRLIAEKVELMETQICDLKDLVNEMVKEEHSEKTDKDYQKISLNTNNSSNYLSNKKNGSCVLNKIGSLNSFKIDSDGDEFVEAIDNINGSIYSDYELAEEGNDVETTDDEKFTDLLAKVDKLFEEGDEGRRQVYYLLNDRVEMDAEFFWRKSKATFYYAKQILDSTISSSSTNPKDLIYEAFQLASKAVEANDQCADAHKWYAITLGSTNDYEGVNVRIQNGYTFKEHIEKAIKLKPTDPSNYHLLGRWSYGVYMLSWVERKVASTIYSTPPSATIQQSLDYFLKAEELNPGKWIENELYISKCYVEMGNYNTAGKWLKKCQKIQAVTNEDRKCQKEVGTLISKYSYYFDHS